jgi:hypothetical protein
MSTDPTPLLPDDYDPLTLPGRIKAIRLLLEAWRNLGERHDEIISRYLSDQALLRSGILLEAEAAALRARMKEEELRVWTDRYLRTHLGSLVSDVCTDLVSAGLDQVPLYQLWHGGTGNNGRRPRANS